MGFLQRINDRVADSVSAGRWQAGNEQPARIDRFVRR